MHTSDSEEDEEVPEWAGDIMKDLAIIAEDKVPASLRDIDASPALLSSRAAKDKAKSENVFDRLTNSDNFTGVQKKRKTTRQKRVNKPASTDFVRGGQEERLALSRSVTESLGKVIIPDETPRLGLNEKGKELFKAETSVNATLSGKSDDSRSVFERLLSPSNYTGTQKERVHHNSGRQEERDAGKEPDALLDELLASDVETQEKATIAEIQGDIIEQIRSKVSDYTQQDVFERLQRTTTQSYAVKHSHPPIRSPTESAHVVPVVHTEEVEVVLDDTDTKTPATTESSKDHSEYFRQNVFERLQKTTTQAYAKKTKSGDK
jgi:hypothetical protein